MLFAIPVESQGSQPGILHIRNSKEDFSSALKIPKTFQCWDFMFSMLGHMEKSGLVGNGKDK